MSATPDSTNNQKDIRFPCPACKGRIVVDVSAAGFYANCPHCKARMLIPRQTPAAAPPTSLSAQVKALKDIPSAAQTKSGARPNPPVDSVLLTTQKIATPAASKPPLGPPPAANRELLTTQKISAPPASPIPLRSGNSATGADRQPVANKLEPIRTSEQSGVTATTDGNEARQSLTNLIEGLKRENAALKKKFEAVSLTAPTATSVVPPLASSPKADELAAAEVTKLRDSVVLLEAARKQSESAAAQLRSDLDSARSSADHFRASSEAATAREQSLIAERDELRAAAVRLNADIREHAEALLRLQAESARTSACAMTQSLDLATLRETLARLQAELVSATRARDVATADIAHARQSLREDARLQQSLQSSLDAAHAETERAAREAGELRSQMADVTRQAEERIARAPKTEDMVRLQDELAALRTRSDQSASELAGLRMSEMAFRNRYTELTGEIEKLSAVNRNAAEEIEDQGIRIDRLTDENDRLLSEKSALVMALDEAKDRAQQLDAEKWRSGELSQKVAALSEENEFIREQLAVANKVAADVQQSIRRIAELEGENEKLLAQIKQTEHEISVRASPGGVAMIEARYRRRIEELEATLRTAESVTHTLRTRMSEMEKDQRRQPAVPPEPPPEAVAALEEKVTALQKRLFESDALARKMQNERDAATNARIEAEAAVDALSGQARDLQDHLDALNKKIAASPASAILAELPQPLARKTKHGATNHGDVKQEGLEPIAAKVVAPVEPAKSAAVETPADPAARTNSPAAAIAIVLALAASIAFLWYISQTH